jgi:hypothetical protein
MIIRLLLLPLERKENKIQKITTPNIPVTEQDNPSLFGLLEVNKCQKFSMPRLLHLKREKAAFLNFYGIQAHDWRSYRMQNTSNSTYDLLDPGKFSFPYHFHRAAEELFVILSGEAILRFPEGCQ